MALDGLYLVMANKTTNLQQAYVMDIMEGRWDERKDRRGHLAIILGVV